MNCVIHVCLIVIPTIGILVIHIVDCILMKGDRDAIEER